MEKSDEVAVKKLGTPTEVNLISMLVSLAFFLVPKKEETQGSKSVLEGRVKG